MGGAGSLGITNGETNGVSQVDGDSDIVPTSWLCVGVDLRKGTVASATSFFWHEAAVPALTLRN